MSIGIVGLGYVGLRLAVAFAEAGEQVIGVDVDHGRVAALTSGDSPIEDIPDHPDELGVGEGLRTGQRDLSPQQIVAQQCVRGHR